MAPSRPKESATSKQTTTRTTTPKSTGGTSTKPKDNNRVVKASRPETGTASYDAKAVEARRARDAQLADRCAEGWRREQQLLK